MTAVSQSGCQTICISRIQALTRNSSNKMQSTMKIKVKRCKRRGASVPPAQTYDQMTSRRIMSSIREVWCSSQRMVVC